MDRHITFIDGDDNPLVVWLKEDCIQLSVIDSRPELSGLELYGLATALFAAYVGGSLAGRLDGARKKLDAVRDQLAAAGGFRDLVAALDGSLAAVAAVRDAMVAATEAVAPAPEAKPARSSRSRRARGAADEAAAPSSPVRRRRNRGDRAGERPRSVGWGWGVEVEGDAWPSTS
jgi:hypothetical protein